MRICRPRDAEFYMPRVRISGLGPTTLAGILAAASVSAQSGSPSLVDLGPGTRAYGINATGQVTGCVSIGTGAMHAFLYTSGTVADLGTLGGASSCGLALNASGEVTGYADTAADRHAFLFGNGVMTDLSTVSGMPTTNGRAITAGGDVVGDAPAFGGTTIALLYSHGVVTNLFPANTNYVGSKALAINDSGVIAGIVTGPCGILCPTYQPFTQVNGVTTDLPLPSGTDGAVFDLLITGINAAGQIVGSGEDPAGFFHGALYSSGNPLDLGQNTSANGINSNGDVVGNSNVARLDGSNPNVGVFLYSSGVARDLNLPGLNPTGINENGWIVSNHAVFDHAYVLRPSATALTPTGLAFGNVPISIPSSKVTVACGSCTVTLANASLAAVTIGNIAATQSYSVAHNCPASLATGAMCALNVIFTPTNLGIHAGALTVNAGGTAYATLLMGAGVPLLALTPGSAPAVAGHPFTIEWQADSGSSCNGSGGNWNASGLPASGSQAITESAAGNYTYSLGCSYGSNNAGYAKAQLSVVVQPMSTQNSGGGGSGSMDPWLLAGLAAVLTARRRLYG